MIIRPECFSARLLCRREPEASKTGTVSVRVIDSSSTDPDMIQSLGVGWVAANHEHIQSPLCDVAGIPAGLVVEDARCRTCLPLFSRYRYVFFISEQRIHLVTVEEVLEEKSCRVKSNEEVVGLLLERKSKDE